MATDRERINMLLDQMSKLQVENDALKDYAEILEKVLGVVHLDNIKDNPLD